MTEDLMERLARALHDGWAEFKAAAGCVYGPERSSGTHPHLVPWAELDTESKNQDRFIAARVLCEWESGRLEAEGVAAAIHESWVVWESIHGVEHPHAKPYDAAHADDPGEHAIQARRALEVLSDVLRRS